MGDDVALCCFGRVCEAQTDEVAGGAAEGTHPPGCDEEAEQGQVQDDEEAGKVGGEEGFLGEELPVYGPFVFEGAGELEGAAEVGPDVFAEEGDCDHELGGVRFGLCWRRGGERKIW